MKTLVIASQKGGAGKSTLAAHLSVLAEAGGASVRLIDTDPQGSLLRWFRRREAETPEMIACEPSQLAATVKRARAQRVDVVIVDTPPHASATILCAMAVADFVLVPTRPGQFDLEAVAATLELAARSGKSPEIVLNHTPPTTQWGASSLVTEARGVLIGLGAKVARSVITQRISLSHALNSGQTVGEFEPAGKAAREIEALWREINTKMKAGSYGCAA